MTILKRISLTSVIHGTPPVAAVPDWVEFVPDPVLPTQASSAVRLTFPWASTSGASNALPQSGSSMSSMSSRSQTGGSLSGSPDYYTAVSLNGVQGVYLMIARADGTYSVVRA